MTTVPAAAPPEDDVTSSTRGNYSTVDAAYLRRRKQLQKARQRARQSRR